MENMSGKTNSVFRHRKTQTNNGHTMEREESTMLETGIRGEQTETVREEITAARIGSGELPVLATPAIIALAEKTAWTSVADELEDSQGTVGSRVDIAHIAPTPVGQDIRCETELTEIDGRRLVFTVTVFDERGKVAEGTHERFIIENTKFMEKANR